MGKEPISQEIVRKMRILREQGYSLPEIKRVTGGANATIMRYVRDVLILPEFRDAWRAKQGGSKQRAFVQWNNARRSASERFPVEESDYTKILILACLYWGEGTKQEFNISNSDPALIAVFVECLKVLGVKKEDLRVNVRTYEDIDIEQCKSFWAKVVGIPENQILSVNVLKGKKLGKLKYGMCRVRVRKGAPYFKFVMSYIEEIKRVFRSRSSTG